MTDERVRQAITYAFDRKTLLETVFGGAGQLLWIDAGFDPDDPELEQYEFDPDKAKELIAAAVADGTFDPASPDPGHLLHPAGGLAGDRRGARERPDGDRAWPTRWSPPTTPGWTAAIGADEYEISLQCCGSPGLGPWKAPGIFNSVTPVGTRYADSASWTRCSATAARAGDKAVQDEAYRDAGGSSTRTCPYNWLWAVANTDANTDKLTPIIYAIARETFSQIEKWTLAP